MQSGLTKRVNGPITAAYVGCRTISCPLTVFITDTYRLRVAGRIIVGSSLVASAYRFHFQNGPRLAQSDLVASSVV